MILHTAAAGDNALGELRTGRPDLAGPYAHWAVLTDGRIAYVAPEAQRVSHVGRAIDGVSNQNTLSIQATGLPAFADERQVESLVRLVADVADRWQIPTDRIFSHAEVAIPAGRKQDMGQQAPAIREMVEAVRARKSAVFQSARR